MCTGRRNIKANTYPGMGIASVKGNQPKPKPKPAAATAPTPKEPEPKMRTINRTATPGTTITGQQTTQSASPSRRRKTSARMGRRSGTNSLRIARNPNTGSGNLNY